MFAALPHLARLVHGNVCSIQKLVKEFREYWSRHTADGEASMTDKTGDMSVTDGDISVTDNNTSVTDNNASVTDNNASVTDADGDVSMTDKKCDTSLIQKDMSMTDKDCDTSVIDKDGDTSMIDKDIDSNKNSDVTSIPTDPSLNASHIGSPDGIDGCVKPVCRYTFSKRQLDKTIRKLGVYEKRTEYRRTCWYVHQHLLEKFSLTDLPIPTEWQWLTRPNVDPTKKKKKLMTPRVRNTSTPVRSNTPTIKQFAVPNMKPIVNPVQKRPQFSAAITSPGGCVVPIVIDDDACSTVAPSIVDAAPPTAPSGEKVISNALSLPYSSTAVLTQLPQVSTSGGRSETVICEDSDNSLILHFSESESGMTDGHTDIAAGQVAFPKFPKPPSSGQIGGKKKEKERVKPRRVMPTLLSMFNSQTQSKGMLNGAKNKPGANVSTPIEID